MEELINQWNDTDEFKILVYIQRYEWIFLKSIWNWNHNFLPIPVAARSQTRVNLDRSNAGVVGSNPGWGMAIYPCFSVLCCHTWVVALRKADPPSKESYQNIWKDM
jgi:hypothetical protein